MNEREDILIPLGKKNNYFYFIAINFGIKANKVLI